MEIRFQRKLPPVPVAPLTATYGTVALTDAVPLLASLDHISPYGAKHSVAPKSMEEYFIG